MVFAGLYPVDANQYEELRDALDKLRLNDASFFYEPESQRRLVWISLWIPRLTAHGDCPGAAGA